MDEVNSESFIRSLDKLADSLLGARSGVSESAPADLKAYEMGIALGQRLAGASLAEELANFWFSGCSGAEIRSNPEPGPQESPPSPDIF